MESLDSLYYEAYALVEQGICFDEVGHDEGALSMYERALDLIDRASKLPDATSNPQYQKMARARQHIAVRLGVLRGTAATGAEESNDEPFEVIENTLEAFGDSKSVDELFVIPSGVQLFFIRGDNTGVPSYPTSLKIFKFRPDSTGTAAASSNDPPAFLQVGDWTYPLIPGMSAALHSSWGAYVFPNPTADKPDLYVGLLLPQDLDAGVREQFENYLKELAVLRVEAAPVDLSDEEKQRLSSKIAKLLVSTGEMIAWGIQKGAEKTSQFAADRGEKYRKQSMKGDKIVNVDPRLQTSVHYLRKGSKVAVKVSGFLVDTIGKVATTVGKSAAASVEKRLGGASSTGGGLFHDTVEVATGGIVGAATVWMGLENAAKSLAKNISNETVRVVDHKYGDDAARLTNNALFAAGHGTMTALNVKDLGPKAIAKRTAKKASIGLLQDLGSAKVPKQNQSAPTDPKK